MANENSNLIFIKDEEEIKEEYLEDENDEDISLKKKIKETSSPTTKKESSTSDSSHLQDYEPSLSANLSHLERRLDNFPLPSRSKRTSQEAQAKTPTFGKYLENVLYKVPPSFRSVDHKQAKYRCFKCPFSTDFKPNLFCHLRVHITADKVDFKPNNKPMEIKTTLASILKTRLLPIANECKCTECTPTTNVDGYIEAHLVDHKGTQKLKCSRCDYITNCYKYYNEHIRSHVYVHKKYKCSECHYCSRSKNKLQKHQLVHCYYSIKI